MGLDGAQEESMKQNVRGQGATFERMTARVHNINQLKSNGFKMADNSNSTKSWSSAFKLNDTPRGAMKVPKHYRKTKGRVVPQLLE